MSSDPIWETAREYKLRSDHERLLSAIEQFHKELFAWLYEIDDERLLEFKPLDAWGPVLDQCRVLDQEQKHHWPKPS